MNSEDLLKEIYKAYTEEEIPPWELQALIMQIPDVLRRNKK